jgi:hypothetical protein
MSDANPEFVTLGQAQERFGLTPYKLRQLIKAGKLPTYVSDFDHRQTMVMVAELLALGQPRPAKPTKRAKKVAA